MKTDLNSAARNGNKGSLRERLVRDQRGAGLVEYAMLAGLVAIAAIAAFSTFGGAVSDKITKQATTVGTITEN